jgi:3-oxoacyl-[acyl-carrier protein] reductase
MGSVRYGSVVSFVSKADIREDGLKELEGKVALITGAAQGMGAAIARLLAQQGAQTVLCDINGGQVQRVAEQINAAGYKALGLVTDITQEDQVAALVETCITRFGTVHVLVNNAGVLRSTKVDEITREEWDLVLDVNLKGTFFCAKAVLPVMKRDGFGRIINMASSAGRSVSTLGGAHYTTAKAGVIGFTRALAKEVAPFGITANAVCPGLIDTEMARANCSPERLRAYEESFPIPRLGTPEEVARLVLFLAVGATYITGASLDINGGDLML